MLARAYLWQRRADEARSTVAEMTTLAREWAERSPDDADALVEWSDAITLSASVAELAGEPPGLLLDQAVAILRRARKLDPTSRSSRDSLQVALADLGALAFAEGRFDDAARLYEEGLGLLDETALEDPEHLDTQLKIIDTQANLAACLRNRGRFAESASRLRPAVERLRSLKGEGRLRGLAVYENERLPLMEADLALAEAAPRALADREYARTRPAPLAARLLAFRLRDAAGRGDDVGVAAEAEALLGLEAVEASELLSLARARAACYPLLAPGLRERCAARVIDALGRALEFDDEAAGPLLGEPIFDGVRGLPEFRALADRFLGIGSGPR
jgi:tetratricopeptide (TPR) repeat protein